MTTQEQTPTTAPTMSPSAWQDVLRLHHLYQAGFHDAFLDRALRKIIEQQVAQDETRLAQVVQDLYDFEQQYAQSSDRFHQDYQAGKLEDTFDFMEWNTLCKMRQRLLARLAILQGDIPHA
jgi:hypothetical protein